MIQVRNVSEKLHRELVRRAKRRALTLSDYIKDLLERDVRRPMVEDVLDRIESSPPIDLGGKTGADLIHEDRTERERRIDEWLDS